MFSRSILFLVTTAAAASATIFDVVNNCDKEIYPAFFPGNVARLDTGEIVGGFPLASKGTVPVSIPPFFSGRVWARTGCNASGVCATGGCPGSLTNCTGPAQGGGSTGPTLAQFTLDGYSHLDYFNPTVADGFNVAVSIKPKDNTCPNVKSVACTNPAGVGNGCGSTTTCPVGTNYVILFC